MHGVFFWPPDLELVPFLRKVQLHIRNTNAVGSGYPMCVCVTAESTLDVESTKETECI